MGPQGIIHPRAVSWSARPRVATQGKHIYGLEEEVLSPCFTEDGDPIFEWHVENDRGMADTMRRHTEGVLSHGIVDGIRGEVLAVPFGWNCVCVLSLHALPFQ